MKQLGTLIQQVLATRGDCYDADRLSNKPSALVLANLAICHDLDARQRADVLDHPL